MKILIMVFSFFCALNIFAQSLPSGKQKTQPSKRNKQSSRPKTVPAQTVDTRKAVDLIAFPNAGHATVGAKFFSSAIEYTWQYQSREYSKGEILSKGIDYEAGYAFNDYWGARITAEQEISGNSKVTYGPATSINGQTYEYKSSGFDDPEFEVIYRAMDISKDKFDMNIKVSFSPKLQDAESATFSKKGNNAKGGRTFGVEIEWGSRGPSFSWMVGFDLTNYGTAESKDAEDGEITEVTSYNTFLSQVDSSGKFQPTSVST